MPSAEPLPGGALTGAGALARASWTIWRRHASRAFGVSVRVVDGGIAVAVLLCAALAGLVSAFVVSTFAGIGYLPPGADLTPFTRITAAGALIGGALPQLLLAATRPRTTALGDLVAVLPVGAAARAVGERMPTVALGAVLALVLSAPLGAFLTFLLSGDPAGLAAALGAHLVLIVLAALAGPAAFDALHATACRLRLPHAYASAGALAVLVTGLAVATVPASIPRPRAFDPLALLSPVEAVAQLSARAEPATASAAAVSLVGWAALAAGLAIAVARHPFRGTTADETRLLVGIRPPRTARAAAVAVHGLALLRLPQFLLFGVGSVVLAAALATPVARAHPALTDPLATVPLVAPFAIAMFAVGLTRPNSWWVRATGRSSSAIAADRLVAAAGIAAPPAVAAAAILLVTGTAAPDAVGTGLGTGLVLCIAASLGGALVPWSQQSPLATAVTSTVSFLVFAIAVAPLQLAAEAWLPAASVSALAVSAALLLGAWAMVARRERDDDLAIA